VTTITGSTDKFADLVLQAGKKNGITKDQSDINK
jgi:hypothetical protein